MLSNPCFRILEENCINRKERLELYEILENNAEEIGSKMISNIYGNALLLRSDIDFDDIPLSRGDIQQCRCYPIVTSSLSVLSSMAAQMKIKIPEIQIVETSISYIKSNREIFQRAFKMRNDTLIMYYNILVYSCVELTSLLLAIYIDYVKTPSKLKIIVRKDQSSSMLDKIICVRTLNDFNKQCKTGNFKNLAKELLSGKISRTVESTSVVSEGIVGTVAVGFVAAMSIIPILRTAIYYFYYSRMKISNFLEQQIQFLQLNEANINSTIDDPTKRKDVLDNQKKLIAKFEDLSDKIKINDKITTNKVNAEIQNENKKWTLDSIKSDDEFDII